MAHCKSVCSGLDIITGRFIQLEPISEELREELRRAANHEQIWTYMPQKPMLHLFDDCFDDWLIKMNRAEQITYAVRRKACYSIVGATSYYDIEFNHKSLSLGYSWYIPEVWGTEINPESKLLMLTQAFEQWHLNRVEIGTDTRNIHSYNAIKKLGATQEGILRQHMILQDGSITDTALFSIIAAEWPDIKEKLIKRIS